MSRTDSTRKAALLLLTRFQDHILPGALRRVAAWKGISPRLLGEWSEDVMQELAVDCLEHARSIMQLEDRDRHARWMRAAERVIYRQRKHLANPQLTSEEAVLSPRSDGQPDRLDLGDLVTLNNGRANVVASIRQTGKARRKLRKELDDLAAKLGWNHERQTFWQARVSEALTGLAADTLRDQQSLHLLETSHKATNPEQRRIRLRRLGQRFPIQPSTLPVRRTLQPWLRGPGPAKVEPRRLLEQAVTLWPEAPASWLWLFEACCCDQDHHGAMQAIRAARGCPRPPRSPIVLGRARLLEVRGRPSAGLALLRRASHRWPLEALLKRALQRASAATPPTTC